MSQKTSPRAKRQAPFAVEESPQVDLREESRVSVDCLVCGSSDSRLVCAAPEMAAQRRFLTHFYRRRWRAQNAATAIDRLAFTQNYTTNIVACLSCGLLYRNRRPSSKAIGAAYQRDRYDDAYLLEEFANQRGWARYKIPMLRRHLAERRPRAGTPRILEVGSFVGGFLAEAQAAGWDVFGVDPGDEVTAFCRSHNLPVFHGTLEHAELVSASFDAVVIWNTFDQLPDPHPTLVQAARLLRNGGLLIIRVPNGACYDAAMSLNAHLPAWLRSPLHVTLAWNNLLTFPYLYGYAPDNLSALAASHGFRRIVCRPDTLLPVPAGHPKLWARVEERCCQWLCRAGWHTAASRRLPTAPWLDLYFERACVDERRADAAAHDPSLGLIPVYAPSALSQTS